MKETMIKEKFNNMDNKISPFSELCVWLKFVNNFN